ncbi:MAG: HDIG domain-containing protein [Firmicutes bacterium]|nr:HDIG domain-containing protein [Bacillota bacterium]
MANKPTRANVFSRRFWRRPVIRRALLLLFVYLSLSLLLFIAVLPESIQLEVGQASPRYIGAPRTVEDRYTTNEARELAKQSVKDVFEQDPNVAITTAAQLAEVFEQLQTVASQEDKTTEEKVALLQETLPIQLPEAALYTGLRLSAEDCAQMEATLGTILEQAYARGIKAEALTTAEEQVHREINGLYISNNNKTFLRQLASVLLKPNMLYNATATERLRQEAVARVLPVMVQKGQKIIGQGEIATEREIMLLTDLGLLSPGINWHLVGGALVYMFVALLPLVLYLTLFARDVWESSQQVLLLGLIVLLTGGLCKAFSVVSGLLMPVATASILMAVLIGPRIAMAGSISMALIAGALAGFDTTLMGVGLIGAAVGAFSVSRMNQRFDLVRAGALIAIATSLSTVAFGLLHSEGWTTLVTNAMWAVAGGVLAAIIGFGIVPFLERPFGIASTVKMLELSNPNQPLLKRLLVEAPGTYNHSVIVANLAEAAAEAVGADGLLARVGSYYHDVGKLKRPYFFIENQFTMENPHDKYPPSLSALVITAHIKDGVELAREYKLPQVIIDIIQQHHGTTLVNYFYHKAKEAGDAPDESDYRYPGPTPRSKEAAIVMLADCVEAAVRSLSQPTPNRIDSMVRKIIKERLNDGQLDECDITLKELDSIGTAFVHILSGIFHKRIEYPEKLAEGEGEKQNHDTDPK